MAEHGNLMGLRPEEAARERESEADAHLARGDADAALHALNKAIFLCPLNTALYAKRALVYCDLCDVKSAMASYRKLLSIDKNPSQRIKDQFAALLDLHAYSLLTLDETPSITIAYLTEALQLNALEETYWLHRALAFIQANALDKALKDVDHCICLNSTDVEYFVLRAKLHWRLHMHDKANSDILRASRLMPDHPEVVEHEQRLLHKSQAIFDLARKELVARRYSEAIEQLTKAIEISPEEQRFYLLRASAKRELGECHAALKDTEKALSCHQRKIIASHHGQPVFAHTQYQRTHASDTSKEYWEIATQRNLILNDIALRFLRERSFQLALNAMNQTIRGEMELKDAFRDQIVNPQYFVNRGDAYRGLNNFQAVSKSRTERSWTESNSHWLSLCRRWQTIIMRWSCCQESRISNPGSRWCTTNLALSSSIERCSTRRRSSSRVQSPRTTTSRPITCGEETPPGISSSTSLHVATIARRCSSILPTKRQR